MAPTKESPLYECGALAPFAERCHGDYNGAPSPKGSKKKDVSSESSRSSPLRQSRRSSDPDSGSSASNEARASTQEAIARLPSLSRMRSQLDGPADRATSASSGPSTSAAATEPVALDIDALIATLEEEDRANQHAPETSSTVTGNSCTVPDDWLNTKLEEGLTTAEVESRRRKCGFNQMNEEKDRPVRRWLGYFHGPIQYVMLVSIIHHMQGISFERPMLFVIDLATNIETFIGH